MNPSCTACGHSEESLTHRWDFFSLQPREWLKKGISRVFQLSKRIVGEVVFQSSFGGFGDGGMLKCLVVLFRLMT
ncbi:hypothetical protein V2J09_000465 [Rumex salicifolius]